MMKKAFWLSLALIAGLVFVGYQTRAFKIYFRVGTPLNSPPPIDAQRRWREVQYVFRGRNPYDVAFAHAESLRDNQPAGQSKVRRNSGVFDDLGVPEGIVYPPWAFPGELIFYWPTQWHIQYFGFWMLAGMTAAAFFGASEMKRAGGTTIAAVAVGLSVVACAAWGGAVTVGNNPPILVGSLVLSYALLMNGWEIPAGLAMGLALLKPTVAGPFLLPLLMTRRWTALLTVVAFICGESAVTWVMTHTDPLEMVRQMLAGSRPYVVEGFGPAQYLMHAGIPQSTANAFIAALVLIVAGVEMFMIRKSSLAAQFSVAAVAARLWSYHLYYDDAILIFTLVYFACQYHRRSTLPALIILVLLLMSLWLPGRIGERPAVQVFHLCVWMIAGFSVLWFGAESRAVPGPESMRVISS